VIGIHKAAERPLHQIPSCGIQQKIKNGKVEEINADGRR